MKNNLLKVMNGRFTQHIRVCWLPHTYSTYNFQNNSACCYKLEYLIYKLMPSISRYMKWDSSMQHKTEREERNLITLLAPKEAPYLCLDLWDFFFFSFLAGEWLSDLGCNDNAYKIILNYLQISVECRTRCKGECHFLKVTLNTLTPYPILLWYCHLH